MLDYTVAAGKKILRDLKKLALIVSVIAQIFSIVYLIYAIGSDTGIFPVNLIALILSCAYFGFFIYNHNYKTKAAVQKTVTRIFKWSKRLIKLFNLGIAIYAVIFTSVEPSALSVVFTVIMSILWVSDIIFEIAIIMIQSWWELLLEGLRADFEVITKPVNAVGNFFKRVSGKEVEEEKAPTKKRLLLNELVETEKTEKQNERLEKKFLKLQKLAERRAEKAAKKAAKRNPAPDVSDETAITEDENQGE